MILQFYGGVKEIGGNKILLQDKDTKIFLDFGISFSKRQKFFEEFLTPRTANGIGDFLAMNLLPDIPGIYREDLMEHIGRKAEEPVVQGVILSHAHADHANYISFLHKDIPIFCGEICKSILEAVEEQSQRDLENEILSFKKRPLYKKDYKNPPIARKFNTFRTGDKIRIGSLEIEPLHVDHCLTEDTLVQLSDGELVKVKDVPNTSFINVIDFKNNQLCQALALKSEYKGSRIFKIKTKFGEIKSTGEHRFFVLNGLDLIEKKVKDLKEGDFLVYAKKIEFQGKHQDLPSIRHSKIVNVSKKGLNIIRQKRKKKRLLQRQVADRSSLSKFYQEFETGKFDIDLKKLMKILEVLNINKKLFIKKYVIKKYNIKIPKKTSPKLLQLLGYVLGNGSWYSKSKNSPYLEISDKDRKNLEFYNKIAASLFNVDGKIVTKHTNILKLSNYIGKLFYEISPYIFSEAHTRKIPSLVHKVTIKEIAAFLRGLYDAKGSFGHHAIILTSTSKDIIETTKLLLLRFGILSWIHEFMEPFSKQKAYQLLITHRESIIKFSREIKFGSKKKQNKLEKFIKTNKPSSIEKIELIPFNGNYLKNTLKNIKMTTWDFRKFGINIGCYTNGRHRPSKYTLSRIIKFLKESKKGDRREKEYLLEKLHRLLSFQAVFVPITSIQQLNTETTVYDFEVPGYSNFMANNFLVHNSVPGAYGFVIHTSEGAVVYTGDLRMHGLHACMTNDFIDAAKQVEPIAMITEGTRIDVKKTDENEEKVYRESKKEISQNKNLSIVDFNFKDVDRFTTFYNIAKELGKKLVISFKHACFLEQYHKDKKIKSPDSRDNNILIFKPKRLTGTYIDEDYTDSYIKKRLNYPNIITAEEIVKKPFNYMVVLNYYYFNTLVDLKPFKGVYIHSLSEPFNEEMEISFNRMKAWIEHFNMKFVQSHCSGHINGTDLKKLIENVAPKIIFPIHTEHPGLFRTLNAKTRLVKEGKTYKL
ncbi:MAG: LAGLIDADG family homing endonuclease [Thermoplasmatota archaeon]